MGWKGVEGVRWLVEERRWKCVDEKEVRCGVV